MTASATGVSVGVVFTVRLETTFPGPEMLSMLELKEQVGGFVADPVPTNATVHARDTLPVNLAAGMTAMLVVPGSPGVAMVMAVGFKARVKAAATSRTR